MHKATMTGYMKLIVVAMPLEIFAYPIIRLTEVIARRILSRIIFQASSKEFGRRLFFFRIAYPIRTRPAISHLYDRTSKFDSPALNRPRLNKGEKPKEAEDMIA